MLRDEPPPTDESVYLGEIEYANDRFARIRPLAAATSHGWELLPDLKIEFPNHGLVFSLDPLALNHAKGAAVIFTVTTNERPRKGNDWDEYVTDRLSYPYQVIRGFEQLSIDQQRDLLILQGLDRRDTRTPHVILPIGNTRYLRLALTPSGPDRLILSREQDAARLAIFEGGTPTSIDSAFSFEGRYFALPGRQPTKSSGLLNFETDLEFFERLVKFLYKSENLQAETEFNQSSKTLIRHLNHAYVEAGIFNADPAENDAIRNRLRPFLEKLGSGIANVEAIATALLEHPLVKQSIAEKSEAAREEEQDRIEQELAAKVMAELDVEFAEARERLAALQSEQATLGDDITAKQTELDRLDELKILSLADAQGMLDGLINRVRDGGARVQELLATAKQFGLQLPISEDVSTPRSHALPPWSLTTPSEAAEIGLKDLPAALAAASQKCGLAPDLFAHLDVATRSGEIPILTGAGAEILLHAYASCSTGGTVYRVPVDSMVLGVDDLWTHPTNKSETALAVAWRAAQDDPTHMHLACIDGLETSQAVDWLPTFAATFRRSRPSNLCLAAIRLGAADVEPRGSEIIVETAEAHSAAKFVVARLGMPPLDQTRLTGALTTALTSDDGDAIKMLLADGLMLEADAALRLIALTAAAKTWQSAERSLTDLPVRILRLDPANISKETKNA